jgi:hypothetical protein
MNALTKRQKSSISSFLKRTIEVLEKRNMELNNFREQSNLSEQALSAQIDLESILFKINVCMDEVNEINVGR